MRRQLVLLAAPLLLAACALGPKVPAPQTRLPEAFEARPNASAAPTPIDRWWTFYDDPQLQGLIDQALASAPDARSAEERLKEALAVRSEALASFAPQGALQGSGSRVGTTEVKGPPPISFGGTTVSLTNAGITNSYGANFDVSWELDLFGRSFVTRKKANADLAAARFDYEATRASLAANVADQLFQARGLAIQLADAKETARIQHDLADVALKKADHGLGPRSDADQAGAQAAQSDAQVADLETELHAAKRTLLVLIGRGGEPLASLDTAASVGQPPTVPASVPGELLARRPDVREAAAQIVSATGALKLDELALFPKFTLQPGVGLSDSSILGQASLSDSWTLAAGVVQPVLDIPRLKAEIRAQGARADQAVIAYEKAVQTAYGEADNALAQLGSDQARVRLLTAGEAQGRSAYEASRRRYAAGIDDMTTVLGAEQTWRSAHTALTSAQVQAMRRSVQAFKALGGGWSAAELTGGVGGPR